jgi:hypothetical protein
VVCLEMVPWSRLSPSRFIGHVTVSQVRSPRPQYCGHLPLRIMSAKHRLSPEPVPVAKRLHTSVSQSTSRRLQVSFDSLYDELILCIFSHLSAPDLCAAQCINKTWNRLSTDNEIWKALYLKTFGRSRLRGSKGFTSFTRTDGREIRPLPARASLKPAELKDWKWMFRISSNWRKGLCICTLGFVLLVNLPRRSLCYR